MEKLCREADALLKLDPAGFLGTAVKHDSGKPRMDLLPYDLIWDLAEPTARHDNPLVPLSRWWRGEGGGELLAAAIQAAFVRESLDDTYTQEGGFEFMVDLLVPVFNFGAEKYAAWNWAKGFAWSRPYSAAVRHSWGYPEGGFKNGGFLSGSRHDPESKLPHLSHFVWNILVLYAHQQHNLGTDDRPDSPFTWSQD